MDATTTDIFTQLGTWTSQHVSSSHRHLDSSLSSSDATVRFAAMGCAICLDEFDQADGESKRATALTCGHIFHLECLQTWFFGSTSLADHRHVSQKRCPLCTQPATPECMVKLYPSDGNDLDTYLSGQQLWETAPSKSSDATHDHAQSKRLLADLMDFNSALQAYVMAVHGFDSDRTIKAGVQVRRLVVDLTKNRDIQLQETLFNSLTSLDKAVSCFQTLLNDLEHKCTMNKQLNQQLKAKKQKLDKKLTEAQNTTNTATGKLAEAEARMKSAKESMEMVKTLEANVKDMMAATQRREEELNRKQHRLEAQMGKMKLETNLKIANMSANTESRLKTMQAEVDEAQSKAADAAKERAATHRKNCELADQLKKLQQHLNHRKKLGAQASKPMVGESETTARRLKALEARNKSLEAQLKAAALAAPGHCIVSCSNHCTDDMICFTRSSSVSSGDNVAASQLDDLDFGSQASNSAAVATPQPKRKARSRSVLSVEPERLDDETDRLFPMPGFGVLNVAAPLPPRPNQPHSKTSPTTPSSRPFDPQSCTSHSFNFTDPPRHATNENQTSSIGDDYDTSCTKRKRAPLASSANSTNSTTNPNDRYTSKQSYGWLNNHKGVVALGPKRRPKT